MSEVILAATCPEPAESYLTLLLLYCSGIFGRTNIPDVRSPYPTYIDPISDCHEMLYVFPSAAAVVGDTCRLMPVQDVIGRTLLGDGSPLPGCVRSKLTAHFFSGARSTFPNVISDPDCVSRCGVFSRIRRRFSIRLQAMPSPPRIRRPRWICRRRFPYQARKRRTTRAFLP